MIRFVLLVMFCCTIFFSCKKSDEKIVSPTISDGKITVVSGDSAVFVGQIESKGSENILERGVCFGTSTDPTIDGTHISSGTEVGDLTVVLKSLSSGVLYYVRAYVKTSKGVYYASSITFTTRNGQPIFGDFSLKNDSATSVGATYAIVDNGGLPILKSGVCASTSKNPDTTGIKISLIDTLGLTKGKSIRINKLTPDTKYYFRAYVQNSKGVYYGKLDSVTTVDGIVVLSTDMVSNVGSDVATFSATLVGDGGSLVTNHGFVLSLVENPTVSSYEKMIDLGSDPSAFMAIVSELKNATTYYLRSYAISETGIFYGNEVKFTTKTGTIIEGGTSWNLGPRYAFVDANITYDAGVPVVSKGFVYSTSQNPTLADKINANKVRGAGSYANVIDSLSASTVYYVRPYAINSIDTTYGAEFTFTTTAKGNVTWNFTNQGEAPSNVQTLIIAAMDSAVWYYNNYTSITKTLNVSYISNASWVATADGNPNGTIRFGPYTSYMQKLTGMHEIAHTVGEGYWDNNAIIGNKVYDVVKVRMGETQADLAFGGSHFWPFGLNYESEFKNYLTLVTHCMIIQAFKYDGM